MVSTFAQAGDQFQQNAPERRRWWRLPAASSFDERAVWAFHAMDELRAFRTSGVPRMWAVPISLNTSLICVMPTNLRDDATIGAFILRRNRRR